MKTALKFFSVILAAATAAIIMSACARMDSNTLSTVELEEPPPIEAGIAPLSGEYAPGFDALHYHVSLVVPDTGAFITGETTASIRITGDRRDTLALDFTGLAVRHVRLNGQTSPFEHEQGKLLIPVSPRFRSGDTLEVEVAYRGTPDDGLILGRNIHGDPTIFADNWPNRARFWFPSIDHPGDKASVEFTVRLNPETRRQVIANGRLVDSTGGIWRWRNPEPIPTYTMVFGAANFTIETIGEACDPRRCVEVTTWIFPPDTARARPSFARAAEMVSYFSKVVAPFPYDKLAHVQSSTRFGGMENVSAIFYSEEAIGEGRNIELTVAHETAHQWFGDAVTEADWHHLWLSEGFATYFSALFFEHVDGVNRFREIMEEFRQEYLSSDVTDIAVVNPEEGNLFNLLNANNYQKGAWALHMLRRELGDQAFVEGIRDYYRTFEHGTALTGDLQTALENASGSDLEAFFDQWIFSPGHPQLVVRWSWADAQVRFQVEQLQPSAVFRLPLEIELETAEGSVRYSIQLDERVEFAVVSVPAEPSALRVDPDRDVLIEVVDIELR